MEQKKRFCFLILPAICVYVAAVSFIIAGSVTQNKETKQEKVLIIQEAVSAEDAEQALQTEKSKKTATVDKTEQNEESHDIVIDIQSTPSAVAKSDEIQSAEHTETPNAAENEEQPQVLNGMGGADVTPQPEMGIESPELYYTVYRIKPGDMISTLAENYGVTQDTLISVNNIKQSRSIQIGQYIRIPTIPGIVYTTKAEDETPASIAEKYKVSAAKVALVNQTDQTNAFATGTTLFVPDAELDWVTRQEINGDLFTRPLRRGYYISSNYSWRVNPFTGKRTFHNGIDMASPKGTPVYAALAGVVVATGWDNVYGNYVTVAHHSGYKTLYGHLSKISVKKGKSVSTSTKLGEVGSTGQSTGPHLHFTIFKNGRTINPAQLWN